MLPPIAADHVLIASAFVGLLLVAVCYWISRCKLDVLLGIFAGEPKWDFKGSWASNVTMFGALLTTAFTLLKRPTGPDPGLPEILSPLNLLYAFLALVAVLLYLTVQRAEARAPVLVFLICSALTMSAAFGQLGVLILLSDNAVFGPKPALPGLVGFTFLGRSVVATGILGLFVLWQLPVLLCKHARTKADFEKLTPDEGEALKKGEWSLL